MLKIVFIKNIDAGIRVVKQHDAKTGQTVYTLQSLHFDKWHNKGEIVQFENVPA